MIVTVTDAEGFAHVQLAGRIDSATAPLFEQALLGQLAKPGCSVLIDLDHVDYVSSAGLRVFLLGAKKAKGAAVLMVVCSMDENVRRVFAISGFDRILLIAEDVEQGRKMLAG